MLTSFTYNATISACEKGAHWQYALSWFEAILRARLSPSVISYSATMKARDRGSKWQQAINLFEGHADCNRGARCFRLECGHWCMQKQALNGNSPWASSMLCTWHRCGQPQRPTTRPWVLVRGTVNGMWSSTCWLRCIVWKSDVMLPATMFAITACRHVEQWQVALELFELMPKVQLKHSSVTHNAILSAYRKGGQFLEKMWQMQWMKGVFVCVCICACYKL